MNEEGHNDSKQTGEAELHQVAGISSLNKILISLQSYNFLRENIYCDFPPQIA